MNRLLSIATVLTLAVSGTTMLSKGLQADDQQNVPADTSVQSTPGQSTDKSSISLRSADNTRDTNQMVDARIKADLEYRLASLVNSAVSVNGFDDMVGSLARPDRERIGRDRYKDFSELNAALEQFNKDFRAKYNEDFDVKGDQFDRLQFQQGGTDRATVSLADFKGNHNAANDIHGQSNYHETKSRVAARMQRGDASVVYADHVTANEALREYNIRGRDKRPMLVTVSEVKPNGDIVSRDIPEGRIHNADIALRPSDRFGWWLPEVVASDTPRIQPDGAHEGLDANNNVMTRNEVETAANNPGSMRNQNGNYARNDNDNNNAASGNYSGAGIRSGSPGNENSKSSQSYMAGTNNTSGLNSSNNNITGTSNTSRLNSSNNNMAGTNNTSGLNSSNNDITGTNSSGLNSSNNNMTAANNSSGLNSSNNNVANTGSRQPYGTAGAGNTSGLNTSNNNGSPQMNGMTAGNNSSTVNTSNNMATSNSPAPELNPPNGRNNAMNNGDINNTNNNMATGNNTDNNLANNSTSNNVAGDASMMPRQLNFVREGALGNQWRLDINDTITAQQLADNLTRRVKQLCSNEANWPEDVNEAYRMVSRKVLEAVVTTPDMHLSSEGQ